MKCLIVLATLIFSSNLWALNLESAIYDVKSESVDLVITDLCKGEVVKLADEPCAGNGCFVLVSSNMEDNTSINCTGLQISRLPVSFFDNWRNNIRGNVEVIFMNDSNNSNMVRVNLPLAKKWAD